MMPDELELRLESNNEATDWDDSLQLRLHAYVRGNDIFNENTLVLDCDPVGTNCKRSYMELNFPNSSVFEDIYQFLHHHLSMNDDISRTIKLPIEEGVWVNDWAGDGRDERSDLNELIVSADSTGITFGSPAVMCPSIRFHEIETEEGPQDQRNGERLLSFFGELREDSNQKYSATGGNEGDVDSYAFIDLDDFSEINNEYGHSFGDKVLAEIVEFGDDFVGDDWEFTREYGQGDEFLVIMRGVNKDEAEEVMEEFRLELEQLEPNEVVVTASIGIASYPEDGDEEDDVIEAADQAMLDAEEWGGNTIRVAGNEVPTEEVEVWFEEIMRVDEGDYLTIQLWLDDDPNIRAARILNETKEMDNESDIANMVMSATKYEEPISGVVTDIMEMSSKETRFKMNVKISRLEEVNLI